MTKEEANKLKEDINNIRDNPLFNMVSKDTIIEIVLEKIDMLAESEKSMLYGLPSEDCVARSEALDILDDFEEDVENGKFKTAYAKARERMCELPPVTPSYNSIKSDLKPCEDWKFYYKHGYTQAKRDLLCEDCISREAVDNYIVKLMSGYLYDEERARLEDLTAYIWELPSVIPSRPSGKWKRISPAGIYECTNCNQVIMTSDIDCYKYCHGCGARMEGEE